MTLIEDLRPISKNRVIDLVKATGVDVSDWKNFARGQKWEAANPKYCYEWSFIQSGRIVVLNFWHANLRESGDTVSVSINMHEEAKRLEHMRAKAVWVKRAYKMDEAISTGFNDKHIVRVILNQGEMHRTLSPDAKASVVKQRALDPVPWTITHYDPSSGQARLVRGGDAVAAVDQFDLKIEESPKFAQVNITSKVYQRDPTVRAAALVRAKGHCEFCGQPGFATSIGRVFLETHHIIPLSEGGLDMTSNVAAICANHHREAHYGAQAGLIRDHLLQVASSGSRK
jgi:5-methylcytosine-specific restriction enzyme A